MVCSESGAKNKKAAAGCRTPNAGVSKNKVHQNELFVQEKEGSSRLVSDFPTTRRSSATQADNSIVRLKGVLL
jgi:hypothetical protein